MKTFNAYNFFIEERNINANNSQTNMIISKKEEITYGDFHKSVTQKYEPFFSQIGDCSRMGILLPDSIFQQILFWGALRQRITPAIFPVFESKDSVIKTLNAASIDILITDENHVQIAAEAFQNCQLKRVYVADQDNNLKLIYRNLDLLQREKEGRFILFSSGTTGISKGIVHNQEDMKHAALTYGEQVLKLSDRDVLYSMATLNYGFAFTNSTFQAVYGRSTVIIDQEADMWSIVENIKNFRPTVICGVPAIFDAIAKVFRSSQVDLSFVRLALSSGEKMPQNLWDMWKNEFKVPIIEGYGSVEMLTNVISNSSENYRKGSSGRILDGFDFKFLKLESEDADCSGVLSVFGDSISNMTIDSQDNQSKVYNTSDVFRVDQDGFFFYCGRKDDMYKVNGVWFNPLSIEKLLESFPLISSANVVNLNMQILAYVVSDSAELFSAERAQSINKWLRYDKKQMICPSKYVVVDKLPRNFNGKKLRVEIDKKHIIKIVEV